MLSKSDPPIGSSPITPFLGEHAFRSELADPDRGELMPRIGHLLGRLQSEAHTGIQSHCAQSRGVGAQEDRQRVPGCGAVVRFREVRPSALTRRPKLP